MHADGRKFKTGPDDSTAVACVSRGYDPNRDPPTSVSYRALGDPGTFSTHTYACDGPGRRTSVAYGGTAFNQNHLFKRGYNTRSELTTADRSQGSSPDSPGTRYRAVRCDRRDSDRFCQHNGCVAEWASAAPAWVILR